MLRTQHACHLAPAALPAACRSQRVNSVQRLRHSLLRADRLLEKHEDEVGPALSVGTRVGRLIGG